MKTNFKSIISIIALCICVALCFTSCDLIQSFMGHECADANSDHACDNCGEAISQCADATNDHKCDTCGKTLSKCADRTADHKCDICGEAFTKCEDVTKDHICELCGATLSECADENKDHACDLCGEDVSECADEDKDHLCDLCGEIISECADENKDHACDLCGATTSECADANSDHKCDVCEKALSECVNENAETDHACDICGAILSDCVDENKDHACDICTTVISQCADTDNNHACDVCAAVLSECANANAAEDHNCDVCGKVIDACVDDNNDERCDICAKFLFNLATFDNGIASEYVNGYIYIDGEFKNAKDVDSATMNAATPTRILPGSLAGALKMRVAPTMKDTEKEGYLTVDFSNKNQAGNYYTFVSRINHDAGKTLADYIRINFVDAEGNSAFSFIVTTADGAKMRFYNESGLDVVTGIGRGKWFDLATEICLNGENSTAKLYINGELVYEATIATESTSLYQTRIESVITGINKGAGSFHFDDVAFARTSEKVYG